MLPSLLIVDDEKNTRDALGQLLDSEYEVFFATNFNEAVNLMKNEKFDIILTDLRMAGKNGMFVIDEALRRPYNPICIMMSAYGSVETAVEAIKHGAYDFVTKPLDFEKLEMLMRRALVNRNNQHNKKSLPGDISQTKKNVVVNNLFSPDMIVGKSKAITDLLGKIKKVAQSKATVLLEGETGTGKELFANVVHYFSKRVSKPFTAIHCASLQKNLLESELFGHEKGAFTGADSKRIGLFESSNGGTIFFDEIGEIDIQTQIKLLRFLETKTFNRVGSSENISVDVRIVCATNRNLQKLVDQGLFREDLLYRLNVVTIELPPLRKRVEDIPLLLDHYIKIFAKSNDLNAVNISPEVMKILMAYKWPGNIRELRNFCENAVIFYSGQALQVENMDKKFLCESLQTRDPNVKLP
ncbi:MAG: sigma-54 dependent transcriptional regulator [Puniceicoccales bacterium]|jgi:DNA-binding NtrC family response regulator|nr:sigma-54 dependent transcriptional regulator [Puniceicoccales bacterium]